MHSWKHSQDWWAKMFVFIFVCFNASLSFMPRIMKKKWYTCSSLFHRKDRTAFQKLRRKSGEVVFFEGKTIREVCCHCCGPKSFVFLDKINQYFYCTHCWLILTTFVLQISHACALLYSTERTRQPTRSIAVLNRVFFFLDKINQYFYCTHCWLILTTFVLQISWSFFSFFFFEFC